MVNCIYLGKSRKYLRFTKLIFHFSHLCMFPELSYEQGFLAVLNTVKPLIWPPSNKVRPLKSVTTNYINVITIPYYSISYYSIGFFQHECEDFEMKTERAVIEWNCNWIP